MKDDTRVVRESSFGWMIHRIARSMDERMSAELAQLGLSLPQFPVMMTVLEHDGVTQAEIGRRYNSQAYVISRALDGLEQKGLIERRKHPTSRRAHLIYVTPAGEKLWPRLNAIVETVNADVLDPLSDAERDVMLKLLPRLLQP